MPPDTSKSELQTLGSYDLIAKIAEGGMGWVYKGRHRETGQIVAIKIVPANMQRSETLLRRFENEFRAASALNHPNIVRALDYCGTGSTPFLVMEFVDGESLGQKLERETRMKEHDAIVLISQVAQGLHRAHKMGLIHRDVKPDNIMIAKDGTAKLTDLGLVKDLDAELNLTKTGRGLGTPHFMAPEQFRNAKNADVRCDVYSLAATLYHAVTGEVPFGKASGPLDAWMKKINNEITPPRKLCPELSERADWAIRRAMSADPNLRPATCREFIEDLTGHSTRKLDTANQAQAQQADLWYLIYKDDEGVTHTVKGTTEGIRRSLRERLLGDASNVRACRTKQGPFEPLRQFAEFRDLVAPPPPVNSPAAPPAAAGHRPAAAHIPTPQPTTTPAPHIRLIEPAPANEPINWVLGVALIALAILTAFATLYFFLWQK